MSFRADYIAGKVEIDHIYSCIERWHRTENLTQDLEEFLGLTKQEYGIFAVYGERRLVELLAAEKTAAQEAAAEISKEKMSAKEIDRFIELLQKWKADDLNWGEVSELRELKYRFDDSIEAYYQAWSIS